LRLGDLNLLVSILLIFQGSGTLDITQMIAYAIEMPRADRLWVFIGFIIAIMIKTAVFPFGFWLKRARKASKEISFWVPGFLMPALGYYLLYRITPMIYAYPILQSAILVLGLLIIFSVLLIEIFRLLEYDRVKYLGSISGAVLFCFAGLIPHASLSYFLIGLIFYRLLIYLDETSLISIPKSLGLLAPIAFNALFFWQNATHLTWTIGLSGLGLTLLWIIGDLTIQTRKNLKRDYRKILPEFFSRENHDILAAGAEWLNQKIEVGVLSFAFRGYLLVKIAHWLNRYIEIGLFTNGIRKFSAFFSKFAIFNREQIEDRLEKAWKWMGQKLNSISEGTFSVFEIGTAEKTELIMGDALNSLDRYERKVLKKRMRWDLVWIPMLLIMILILLVVV
jgi:hypothetical protein